MSSIFVYLAATLLVVALTNIFFHLSKRKVHAWIQTFLPIKSSPIIAACPLAPMMEKNAQNTTEELRKVFSTFDRNGDGYITKQELRASLKNIRIFITEKEVEDVFVKLDANGDGLVDLDEFCGLCVSLNGQEGGRGQMGEKEEEKDDDLKEAFDVFDKDKDGLISVEELGLVLSSLGLHEGRKEESCTEMIRKVDMDGDGMVNFHEFKEMMSSGCLIDSAH